MSLELRKKFFISFWNICTRHLRETISFSLLSSSDGMLRGEQYLLDVSLSLPWHLRFQISIFFPHPPSPPASGKRRFPNLRDCACVCVSGWLGRKKKTKNFLSSFPHNEWMEEKRAAGKSRFHFRIAQSEIWKLCGKRKFLREKKKREENNSIVAWCYLFTVINLLTFVCKFQLPPLLTWSFFF